MKEFWLKIWEKLKAPSKLFLAIVYVITALSVASSLTMLFFDFQSKLWLSLIAYCLFATAAITLGYTVFIIVRAFPRTKRKVKERMHQNPLLHKLMGDYSFRTLIFAIFSLTWSVLYGVYNGVVAIVFSSIWYGALATYYILLVCMRSGIMHYHGKNRGKLYQRSGILLMVIILALSVAVAEMVANGASFRKPGILIYVAAAYTTVKLSMSIVNFIKAKKQDDYTIEGIRNINFADAIVSVLALQTAMFQEFASGKATGWANALTGAAVCLLVFALGLYMTIKGRKKETTEDVGKSTEQ